MTPEDKRRDRYYQKHYGITLPEYQGLLQKQDHKCACCRRPTDGLKQRLSIDHNHTTGEIRGLLCFRCNHLLIGRVEDSDVFQRAADYLANGHTGRFVPAEFLKGIKRKRKRRKRK